jgi:hypothetical protein
MSWGLLMRRHAMTLWQRLKARWMTRALERKQEAARGIPCKRSQRPIHRSVPEEKTGLHRITHE